MSKFKKGDTVYWYKDDGELLSGEFDKSECQKWFDDGWFAEKQILS